MVATSEQVAAIVDTYQRAAQANLTDPNRRGNVIALSAENCDDCLISGDLHGHMPNFEALMRIADLAAHPRRHLVLQEVCHGGPVFDNGGCKSFMLLERIAQLKVEFPERVHFLLSNHELSELTDYPILKSKKLLNLMFRLGLEEVYGAATEQVREAYCRFIESCPLAVRLANGVFISHSLPEHMDRRSFDRAVFERPYTPNDLREHGTIFELVWGRDHRADNAHAFAGVVGANLLIHGHEPCPQGFAAPNDTQVILDCCGPNACYVLLPVAEPITHCELVAKVQTLA